MTYTTHGHHIPGTIMDEPFQGRVVRCGRMPMCTQCTTEANLTPKDIPAKSMHYEEQVEWDIDANRPMAVTVEKESEFEKELGHLLNKHSAENESGTPDFILAMFLAAQLDIFNQTIKNRAAWRGESVELPALMNLHREQEEVERFAAYFKKLVEDGVIVVKENLEYTDLYRELVEYSPSKDFVEASEGQVEAGLEEGVKSVDAQEVPFVTYQDGRRNEIGTATVRVTPGEALVEGKTIAAVEAIFLESDEVAPTETPAPPSRFERYQKEGLSHDE